MHVSHFCLQKLRVFLRHPIYSSLVDEVQLIVKSLCDELSRYAIVRAVANGPVGPVMAGSIMEPAIF